MTTCHPALEDFLADCNARRLSKRTIQTYLYVLEPFIACSDEFTPKTARGYLADVAGRNLSSSTLHIHARTLKTFLRFCYREGYIDQSIDIPLPKLNGQRRPFLKPEQLRAVLNECISIRDQAILMFMVDTGVRRAEMLDLRWSDIDLSGLAVIRSGKGGKSRVVAFGDSTAKALDEYRQTLRNSSLTEPVWQTYKGQPLKAQGLCMLLRRVGDRAGVHVSPHMLRRTMATLSIKNGLNVFTLKALLGHSELKTTLKYVTLLDEDLLEAHRQAGPIDSLL